MKHRLNTDKELVLFLSVFHPWLLFFPAPCLRGESAFLRFLAINV